ncbi:short transient receptor potential channel 4-associated protein-like [Ptychodera flava]|uniref:short transient receptor potential channel 4-associated protein-like n=1 Tax=Ptychodera flava TaxID=63121 RepID=UPI00396A6E93
MSSLTGKVVKKSHITKNHHGRIGRSTSLKTNVVKRFFETQTSGRGFTSARKLPEELIESAEIRMGFDNQFRIPQIIQAIANSSGEDTGVIHYSKTISSLKDVAQLLNHEGSTEYPPGSGVRRETRIVNSEIFYLFGGVELSLQILLRPTLYPVETKKGTKEYEQSQMVACACLDVLHQICLNLAKVAVQLSERDDLMPYLFTLMGEKRCFLNAATLMEDLLTSRQQMFRLDEITNLQTLIDSFDQQQLANFCRVLSIAVSDLDSSEDRLTLVAQDEASKKQSAVPVSEINQGILVDLPDFIKRLVEVAGRTLPHAEPSIPSLFSEIDSWVNWLDSSLAFDALMEVAQDDEVFLTIPLDPLDLTSGDTPPIVPHSMRVMHEVMYKVEVLYVLCLLLTGKQRNKVQEMLAETKLIPSLNEIFEKIIWKCNLRSRPIPGHGENCECSPEIALKIQFLRLLHSFCDHHPNKVLLLTRSEVNELNRISSNARIQVLDPVKNVNRQLLCNGQKGLLSKIVEATKREPVESPFRFWLGRAIESFLRGATSYADQTFLLKRGLLEHIVRHMVDNVIKSKEILQSSFDLLGELMKFNINAFKRFNKTITTDVDFHDFIRLIKENIVDSNMFVRCLILSLEHFETEQTEHKEYARTKCRLLQFIHNKKTRFEFLFKLINVIEVSSLTQENVSCLNTTLVLLMFARQKGELAEYLQALRDEEQRECHPGLLVGNFRQLLIFWQDHYLHKDKDCTALEKSSCISFDIWKKTVAELLEDNPSNELTVAHYLTSAGIAYK